MDIVREIDLIEEVSRMFGHDNIPVTETLEIRIAPPQPSELARQAIADELVGHGFVETITHSLVSDKAAKPFLRTSRHALRVEDDRAKAEPALQPSTIPSLLAVRRTNQDAGVDRLKLFETASVFDRGETDHNETSSLGLLMDMDDASLGLRPIRGIVERIGEMILGQGTSVDVGPTDDYGWLEPGGVVKFNGEPVGLLGKVAPAVQKQFDLEHPVMAAELFIRPLFDHYPPETQAKALPSFPSIERDLSFILDEAVAWAALRQVVDGLKLDHMVGCDFVTTFRGKPIPKGRKSLTMRLRFRAEDRTLTHDEVDPQVEQVVRTIQKDHNAELRG
jgi:phenylalanyl-tRNA synthetase beta chain